MAVNVPHFPTVHEVETFSGRYVDTKNPDPATLDLDDIAHALANTCRFGGHCKTFYSVAEHCVFVSKRLERKGYQRRVQLAGLWHDGAEAYLGDIPRPMKPLLGKGYKTLTDKMDKAICDALFGDQDRWTGHALIPADFHGTWVKEADNWALFVEARHLLPSQGRHWGGHPDGASWADDQPSRIVTPDYWRGGLVPEEAEQLFKDRHEELA
jgi:hypothetical protein